MVDINAQVQQIKKTGMKSAGKKLKKKGNANMKARTRGNMNPPSKNVIY